VVGELRRTEPWARRLSRHAVFRVWERVVGEAVARAARPVSVSGGRVVVEVGDSAWMQELELRAEELLARLNAELEGPPLRGIRFLLGPSGALPEGESGRAPGDVPPPERNPLPISAEDEGSIDAALRDLPDPELRGGAERLLERARARAGSSPSPPGR